VRGAGGATDTDNNSADFTKVTQPYAMHNSSSPANPFCGAVPARSSTWGLIKTIYR